MITPLQSNIQNPDIQKSISDINTGINNLNTNSTPATGSLLTGTGSFANQSNPISVDGLKTPQNPITLPQPQPDTTNYNGMVGSATSLVSQTPETDATKQLIDRITTLGTQELGKTAATQQANTQFGVLDKQAAVDKLTKQIQGLALQNSPEAVQLQAESMTPTGTARDVAANQTSIARGNAIQALQLSSQLLAAQSDLTGAQNKATQAIDLVYKPIEDEITFKQQQIDLIKPFLTQEQNVQADALKRKLDAQQTDLADNKTAQKNLIETANNALDSKSAAKAMALDPKSPTFKTDLAAIQENLPPDALKSLQVAKARVDLQKAQLDLANSQNPGPATPIDYNNFLTSRTPQQVTAFNALPENDKSVVAQLVSGDALLTDIVKSRGANTQAQINKLVQEATSIDPNFSINNNKVKYQFLQDWNNPNGKSSITRNAINTALGHLADLKQSSDALNPTDIQKLNSIKNILSTETGSPQVLQLRADISALAGELAKVYGTGTEKEISNYENILAANFSKNQFAGVTDELSKLLSSKITATRYQYKSTMGYDLANSLIDPDKRQALLDAGINPDNLVKENIPVTPENNPFTYVVKSSPSIFSSSTPGMFNIPSPIQ